MPTVHAPHPRLPIVRTYGLRTTLHALLSLTHSLYPCFTPSLHGVLDAPWTLPHWMGYWTCPWIPAQSTLHGHSHGPRTTSSTWYHCSQLYPRLSGPAGGAGARESGNRLTVRGGGAPLPLPPHRPAAPPAPPS